MVYNYKYFIEIASLEPIKPERLFLILKKNLDKSYISLNNCNEIVMRDIK